MGGDVRDDSAEILFQSFLQEALVSSSGTERDVHSLVLSIQHFLSRPRRRPTSTAPWRMVVERPSWRVTDPNHASFRLLTVARSGSCASTKTSGPTQLSPVHETRRVQRDSSRQPGIWKRDLDTLQKTMEADGAFLRAQPKVDT